ncbi:M23 family metallopeptidase [Herbivorax sp. ANBcel31]|uniref:M23 family metallopeptidase n=1 Tax=Herbivorax sp. ANBcel31 TaxID=3069754 RepID=UPI0027B26D18|nr:M23 family metallopeptidase [Herbivorax sp. ANBcel31]MDQ2087771.1 M23 family metallopeptidase [Herbivorax sp. ANBcel31]
MNFKKLFPDKKITQKKILEFFDKKGFFVVLGLCLTIIGVTAYLVASSSYEEEIITHEMMDGIQEDIGQSTAYFEEDEDVVADKKVEDETSLDDKEMADEGDVEEKEETKEQISDSNLAQEDEDIPVAKESVENIESEVADTDVESQETEVVDTGGQSQELDAVEAVKVPKFIMPVHGDIILEFAIDKLVYSKTLNEWRAHTGVGISSERGTPVKVVADGVVSNIKNDPRLGITIIVEHSKDLKTVYANLASGEMVTPNQKVERGEVIGSVGNTASFKAADPSHLHFEVLKENQPVDPIKFLPVD